MWRLVPGYFMAAGLLAFCAPAQADVKYTFSDLGPGNALAINSAGDVVGEAGPNEVGRHAFLYHAGVTSDLGIPFGSSSKAVGINSAGQIIVNSSDGARTRAYYLAEGTFSRMVDYLGDTVEAVGINESLRARESGRIVGNWSRPGAGGLSFTYSNYGGFVSQEVINPYLGVVDGGYLVGINNPDQVVGVSYVRDPVTNELTRHGLISTAEGGPSSDLGLNIIPAAINDAGDIVGSTTGGAFLYHNGQLTIIGGATAEDINNNGDIVGVGDFGAGSEAFLYRGGALSNLNDLIDPNTGFELIQAEDINDSGQIVGLARDLASGGEHAFLLTPIPEPAALPFALLGTSLLLCRRTNSSVRE